MSALSEALNAANVNGWSYREIARRSGDKVSHSLVADYFEGRGPNRRPKEYVLAAFAEVFPSLTVTHLRELAGLGPGTRDPWVPPAEVNRLSVRQQLALGELIRAIAADPEGVDGDEATEIVPVSEVDDEGEQLPLEAASPRPPARVARRKDLGQSGAGPVSRTIGPSRRGSRPLSP